MDPIETLLSRNSHNKLVEPAPTEEQLKIIFEAALRAPDHALLRPWKYRVYTDKGLDRLGDYFVAASLQDDPNLSEEMQLKIHNKPKRAPMVIVASVCLKEHPKVPHVEQILSAGASVQNILMAAHFQNVGAMWRTGSMAVNQEFKRLLHFSETEMVVGFIYLGTELGDKKKIKPFEIEDFVTHFN